MVNTRVDHVRFHGPAEVVEGDSVGNMLAVGDSSLTTGRYKGVFQSPRGNDRLVLVSEHEVMVYRSGEVHPYLLDVVVNWYHLGSALFGEVRRQPDDPFLPVDM